MTNDNDIFQSLYRNIG